MGNGPFIDYDMRPLLLIAVGAVLCVVGLNAGILGDRPAKDVPPELIGRWTTGDPRFSSSSISLTSSSIAFENARGGAQRHLVTSVLVEAKGENNQRRRYEVQFEDAFGGTDTTIFERDPFGRLYFSGRPGVSWSRSRAE